MTGTTQKVYSVYFQKLGTTLSSITMLTMVGSSCYWFFHLVFGLI